MAVERALKKTDSVKKTELEETRATLADEIAKITAEISALKVSKNPPPRAVRGFTGIEEIDRDLFGDEGAE
jgi:hypothetical protein